MKTAAERIFSATFIVPQLCVIAFMALAVSPPAQADVTAFGQEVSIPRNTANGTVVARHYMTPQEVCGQSKCTVNKVIAYADGGGSPASTTIITTNVVGISTRLLINGRAYGTSYPGVAFTQPIEIQLLGDGRENKGGSLAGIHASPYYYQLSTSENYDFRIYLKGTITPIDGTCSVPSQTVKLPKTLIQRLERVGSTAGTQSFQIQVNNCPKGYNRIGYTLNPVGGVITNSPGVLPLAGDSTASGIKIRVENAQGAPATMGSSITVNGYNSGRWLVCHSDAGVLHQNRHSRQTGNGKGGDDRVYGLPVTLPAHYPACLLRTNDRRLRQLNKCLAGRCWFSRQTLRGCKKPIGWASNGRPP
ncbi:fimbrial protein [Pseudomonas chlororaphis]|uniref:fimbrial protein n=1 Tax=Pseudomonas chlororaphis TaxID=587753 RepID=UPI000F6BA711|nr:fimbrial protein [Pseudomonas chlororaphis]AZC96235.1 hypothetical protein C4K28_3508 [Pseudomonas chlororaphis subsp. piscium]